MQQRLTRTGDNDSIFRTNATGEGIVKIEKNKVVYASCNPF